MPGYGLVTQPDLPLDCPDSSKNYVLLHTCKLLNMFNRLLGFIHSFRGKYPLNG